MSRAGGDWTERDRATIEEWCAQRGSRDFSDYAAAFPPLPPLPIAGHDNCRVPGCTGYTRKGSVCVDHFPRGVS